jgi:hypothetical protein
VSRDEVLTVVRFPAEIRLHEPLAVYERELFDAGLVVPRASSASTCEASLKSSSLMDTVFSDQNSLMSPDPSSRKMTEKSFSKSFMVLLLSFDPARVPARVPGPSTGYSEITPCKSAIYMKGRRPDAASGSS